MVCIYCSSKTQVINSRPQKRLGQTWRRRQCRGCEAIFTTIEGVDYATSLVVRSGSKTRALDRDKLFVSILKTLGHRKSAITDASALTATVLTGIRVKAVHSAVDPHDITAVTYAILKRFDVAAAVQYKAYHKS